MSSHVVLLRGINVGRSNRIAMADLRALLEGVGATGVRTYVASGNALVSWHGEAAELAQAVRDALPFDVPVLVLPVERLQAAVDGCPWPELDPKLLHVGFCFHAPDPAVLDAVDHEALAPERVALGDGVVYLFHAHGVQRSGLERLPLGVEVTARNWRTVTALAALADA